MLAEATSVTAPLASTAWANEIIVVDCRRSDDTIARARRHTGHVNHRNWTGYGDQKRHATGLATHDWMLSRDADERVSPDFATEFPTVLGQNPTHRRYRMRRNRAYLSKR